MKTREGLIVPLSRQALAVVRDLQPLTGRGRYLFHCERTTLRPMSENTVTVVLRRLGYTGEEMTGHGFRAIARTILDEVLEYRVEWIEHQLATT
jgi:integrase